MRYKNENYKKKTEEDNQRRVSEDDFGRVKRYRCPKRNGVLPQRGGWI